MAYSVKYLFKFESAAGTTREIRVLKDGYSGAVIQRPLGRAPMLKKQQNGPVHGTSLEFYAECNVDREFIEFYTSNPKDYRVDLYAGSTLLWQGYITPELYSEPDIAPPYDVQVVATDGVGELKLYDYAAQGTVTLRNLLAGLLTRTGLGTDIYLISSLKPGSAGAGSLLEKTINLDYMAGKTCYDVLTYVLDTLHATITWWKGAWILTRETNVTYTNGKVRYFNTAGNSALLNDSVQVLGVMRTNPAWPVGQLSTVIDPAKNKVAVQAPWHPVTCLQNPDMTSDASWTKSNGATYATDGYQMPQSTPTPGITQTLSMTGLRVPMSLRVRATGLTSLVGINPIAWLGVVLTYKVGNVTYYLYKDDTGAPVWRPEAGGNLDFEKSLVTWNATEIEAEDLTVENIPAFFQGNSFPAGTLAVNIAGSGIKVYSAYLDVTLPKGYADILHIGNGARGEGDTVEIAIGRESADNAYYAAFLQGLLLDSGSLITSFSDANFTTGMDYLAFIARDYALSVALPRARVTGTVFLESSVQIPPLVFTKGGLDYWVETWGWNLYEDELEISARTLPSASLTVQSEVILESNGSTVSSAGSAGSSGAGSSMGGGGGTNYWEIDGTLNTLLKPKDAYAYVHSKDGLFFTGATLSGTPIPDLYVDTVNNQRVLRSPLPLITGGDQIVISGTPGGGGGGGGATNLKELEDVYHNASGVRRYSSGNATSTDLLGYDSTKGWYAVKLGTGLQMTNGELSATGTLSSVSLAAGATNGTLHLVVNGTAQSDVAVTGLGSMAYKSSLAASDIPDLSGTYLPLSAGSGKALTGDLYITGGNGRVVLSGMVQYNYNNAMRLLGPHSINSGDLTWYDGTSWNKVWHAGNFNPGSYLPLVGATLSSTLSLKKDLGYTLANFITGQHSGPFEVGRSSNTMTVAIGVTDDNYGYIQSKGYGITSEGNLVIQPDSGGLYYSKNLYPIYHSNNFRAGYEYVSISGDETITGAKTFAKQTTYKDYILKFTYSSNASLERYLGYFDTNADLSWYTGSAWTKVYHSGNSNGTDKGQWAATSLALAGGITGATHFEFSGVGSSAGNGGYIDFHYNGSSSDYTSRLIESASGTMTMMANLVMSSGKTIKIGDATISWNSNGYLHIDQPLVTAGDQIVISGTPGGGGGGGATSLWGLDDVSVPHGSSTPSNGQVLTWDSTLAKWTNQSITSGVSSVVGQTGAVTTAQIATALTGAGYKLTDTTYDMVTASANGLAPMFSSANKTNSASSNSYYFLGITGSTLKWYSLPANAFNNTTYSQGTGISISGTIISLASTYAGGTAVTLNNSSKAANTASFYAPTSGGASNKVLIGQGSTSEPAWSGFTLTGTANTAYALNTISSNASNGNTAYGWGNHANAGYLLTTTAASTYLPLTGGTIQNGSSGTPLSLNTTSSTIGIYFYTSDTTKAWVGYQPTYGATIYNQASGKYLGIKDDGTPNYQGNTLWHSGNDGASSGLDADLLDGQHGSYYATASSVTTLQGYFTNGAAKTARALSTLSRDGTTWYDTEYPVIAKWDDSTHLRLECQNAAGTVSYDVRVTAADKFVTSRTLWGQSFDGTANVTGAMSSVTNIDSLLYFDTTNSRIGVGVSAPTEALHVAGKIKSITNGIGILIGDGGNSIEGINSQSYGPLYLQYYSSGNLSICYGGGNVAIGAITPSYKLHVAGDICTNTYLRINAWSGYGSGSAAFWYNGNTSTLALDKGLSVTGTIVSTGDQVVSSDLTLKTNLTPVTYSVKDIAKARAVEFDWKDGRGHSMGSIAQDWLGIAPALVHGEEGNMSLAYGQLALVNTILLARQSESHEERIARLEKENAELKEEVKRLRMN